MKWTYSLAKHSSMLIAAVVLAGCAGMGMQGVQVSLSGAQEVPAVNTAASGTGTINVAADKSVSATIRTQGIAGTAAHVHEGAAGSNGPVAVPMTKTSDNEWTTAAGAKLTDAQYESYKNGRLYFNVHSTQNKGGEIRGQIKPSGGGY